MSGKPIKKSVVVWFVLIVIGLSMAFTGVTTMEQDYIKNPFQVPGEYFHMSFIGEDKAIELTENDRNITLELGEDYISATGDLNVYYTNSLGLESDGFGGGSSSTAQYSEEFKINLDNQNPKQQIQLQGNYTTAVLSEENINRTVEEKEDNFNISMILFISGMLLSVISGAMLIVTTSKVPKTDEYS